MTLTSVFASSKWVAKRRRKLPNCPDVSLWRTHAEPPDPHTSHHPHTMRAHRLLCHGNLPSDQETSIVRQKRPAPKSRSSDQGNTSNEKRTCRGSGFVLVPRLVMHLRKLCCFKSLAAFPAARPHRICARAPNSTLRARITKWRRPRPVQWTKTLAAYITNFHCLTVVPITCSCTNVRQYGATYLELPAQRFQHVQKLFWFGMRSEVAHHNFLRFVECEQIASAKPIARFVSLLNRVPRRRSEIGPACLGSS